MPGSHCSYTPWTCGPRPVLDAAAFEVPSLVFTVLAVAVAAGSLGVTVWWLAGRGRVESLTATAAGRFVATGTLGGLAMVPPGLLLRGAGYSVNVYGQVLLDRLFGQVLASAMLVEHLAISAALAVPFVVFATRYPGQRLVLLGAGYGTAAWLLINSLVLPLSFGRPTPWALGIDAIWPSLLIHVVYGLVLGAAVTWESRRGRGATAAHGEPAVSGPGR